jgi:hypothetical protein
MLNGPISICVSSPEECVFTDAANHKIRTLKIHPNESMILLIVTILA